MMDANKNPNDSHNYQDGNHDEIEFYQGNGNMSTQHQNNALPKTII